MATAARGRPPQNGTFVQRARPRQVSLDARARGEEDEGFVDDENMHGSSTKGYKLGPMHMPRTRQRKAPLKSDDGTSKTRRVEKTRVRQRRVKTNKVTSYRRASTDLCKDNYIVVDPTDSWSMLKCSLCDSSFQNTSFNTNRHIKGKMHMERLAARKEEEKNAMKDRSHIMQYFAADRSIVGQSVSMDTQQYRSAARCTSSHAQLLLLLIVPLCCASFEQVRRR